MDERDREEFIRRVTSQSSTVGATIPESVVVGGSELKLNEFLIETRKVDRIPPDAEAKIEEAKQVLAEERSQRFDRLKNDPIDHETAETLVDEINGLDRALNALKTIRRPSYGEDSQSARIKDHKKWLDFLDTVRE